jgi:phosphomethylpyrimidine synthase
MTQTEKARKNIITPEMKQAAAYEDVPPHQIREGLANGTIVIPKNINHDFPARAIGAGLSTKLNANIGTSETRMNPDEELCKLECAIKYGADSIMDLSTGGELDNIRKILLNNSPVMFGTVPIYSVMSKLMQAGKNMNNMTSEMLISEIEKQAEEGVDFMTLHCGITKKSLLYHKDNERVAGIVSRGGALIKQWIIKTGQENPLYEYYDKILSICSRYDVTISLGDGFRPGSIADAGDSSQTAELMVMGELVKRARTAGVQVMVEGPGHVPLHEIESQMIMAKKLTFDAPLYVLGPLVTDSAPGYDHITGAIGGALAASHGADFLCYVTPAEHVCLPDIEDVKLGVISTKIAAHAADIAKGIQKAKQRDETMSHFRRNLDWEGMLKTALDPEMPSKRHEKIGMDNSPCSMCGNLCAIKVDSDT